MKSREAILNRIRSAEKNPVDLNSYISRVDEKIKIGIKSVTPKDRNGLWDQFKKELETISGEFYPVKNIDEASGIISKFMSEYSFDRIGISNEEICRFTAERIHKNDPEIKIISSGKLNHADRKKELAVTEIAIVHPSFAVADIGSLVFLYDETGTSLPHFLCDNTFAIINQNQIVANQFELFEKIDSEKSKNMVFISGPSRTADIEKVLVLGAHGPRKLVVILNSEESGI